MASYLGAYVTASLVKQTFTEDYPDGLHEPRQGPRQGVLVQDNGDGHIHRVRASSLGGLAG